MIYPWQQSQWQTMQQAVAEQRLPHALLLVGQPGMGKFEFARELALQLLIQDTPEAKSLFTAGNHPDYFCIQPIEGKKIISINQIRALQKQLQQTAHISQYQVVIINPADSLNIAASNALLKTLEEPPGNAIIILASSQPQRLPATIRSRCQTLSFCQAHDSQTVEWLQRQLSDGQDAELLLNLAHGAPLAALGLVDEEVQQQRKSVFKGFAQLLLNQTDPIEIAMHWQKYSIWQVLTWLQSWLLDISRLQAGTKLTINNARYQETMVKLATEVADNMVFNWLDQLNHFKKILAQHNQINVQLALEDLLIGIYHGQHQR